MTGMKSAQYNRATGPERSFCSQVMHMMTWITVIVSICLHIAMSQFTSDDGAVDKFPVVNCSTLELNEVGGKTIATPNYPQLFIVKDICWKIQLSPALTENYLISVNWNDIDLHIPGDCTSQTLDQVMIVEGPMLNGTLLGRWCHEWSSNTILVSCAPELLVRVRLSHKSEEHRGLNLTYRTVPKDKYDCNAREWKANQVKTGDAAVAGVAIILILAVVVVAVVVIIKTRHSPRNRDDRTSSSFWQSPFDHRRFENEETRGDNFDSLDPSEFNTIHPENTGGGSLSADTQSRGGGSSPRTSSSRPLPIGIPQSYGTDGFPSSYISNVSPQRTASATSGSNKRNQEQTQDYGSDRSSGSGQGPNPLYDLTIENESGLPNELPEKESNLEVKKTDPLSASDLLESSNTSVHLASALEETRRVTAQSEIV